MSTISVSRRVKLAICVLSVLVMAPSCGLFANPSRPAGSSKTIDVQSRKRTYRLHVPPGYDSNVPSALVFVFHGGRGDGAQIARTSRFSEVADAGNFIVVYPDGYARSWNDARGTTPASRDGVDDVAFFDAMLADISAGYTIDPNRVFATGISNGAMMSYRLACERPDKLAAIAPIAGSLPVAALPSCIPEPVSILHIHGTEDTYVPIGGGPVNSPASGDVLSAEESVRHWVEANDCSSEAVSIQLPDVDVDDGSRVVQIDFGPCDDGRTLRFLRIDGGGHTWPNGPDLQSFLGNICRDFDASQTIWRFFAAHPKP